MIKLFYLTNKCKLGISYFVTVMSFIPHMAATFFINSQINIFKETHLPSFTSEKFSLCHQQHFLVTNAGNNCRAITQGMV